MSTPSKYDVPVNSTQTGGRGIQLPPEITGENKDAGTLDAIGEYVQNLVTSPKGGQIPVTPDFSNTDIPAAYDATFSFDEAPLSPLDTQPKGPNLDYVNPQPDLD